MRDSPISRILPDCKAAALILSPDQEEAVEVLTERLFTENRSFVHLDGPAGSGKTTITTGLADTFPGLDILYMAPTNKGAEMQRRRGVDAGTVHHALYGAPVSERRDRRGRKELIFERRSDGKLDCDLAIADECSVLNPEVSRDLINACDHLIVTGDMAQLPPVSGSVFFTEPDFTLSHIHRMALGSQPLRIATEIREHGVSPTPRRFDLGVMMAADIVICAFEKTRRQINRLVRKALGRPGEDPVPGDVVAVFKTNHGTKLFNGSTWLITAVEAFTDKSRRFADEQDLCRLQLVDDLGVEAEAVVPEIFFYGADPRHVEFEPDSGLDVLSYAYATTCHRAQGSEWPQVCVLDETHDERFALIAGDLPVPEFRRRWLYTAVSRARERVTVMEVPR